VNLPKRILVVDDDETAIQVIRGHLMHYDFEVDDLRSSTIVIDHLHHTNDYGLFIFDVNMPNKDGITLATQVRNTFDSTVPILFVSGDIDDKTSNRIRRLSLSGIVEFRKKGEFDSKSLFDVCKAMMNEHQQMKQADEFAGRLQGLQNGWSEFIDRFEKKQVVTQELCDAKAKAIVTAVRTEVIGIVMGKTKTHVAKVVTDDLTPKIEAAAKAAAEPPTPEAVSVAVEKSQAFRILKWAVGIIAALYGSWLAYTFFTATKAATGVELIKAGQSNLKSMMVQQNDNIKGMRRLMRSMHRSRRTTR
jgi:CheY-like chemotaxis protein